MPPRFSIVTPVFNTPLDVLEACLASVRDQTLTEWQHCLIDDASDDPSVTAALEAAAAADPRVVVRRRDVNGGIGVATNDALALATGDFVAFLDHDDLLAPDALARVQAALADQPDADVIYTDEDKVLPDGTFGQEFRKPCWSPERFRAQNYLCHLSVVRRSLLDEIGGCRPTFDGSQDYDLLLRATERARHVVHVPDVLYHWRILPGSTAGDTAAKPYAYEAGRRAIADHCIRVGIDADVRAVDEAPGCYQVHRRLTEHPLVSIVIPTAGARRRVHGVDTCLVLHTIGTILERTTYPSYELIVVVDGHTPTPVVDQLASLGGSRLSLVRAPSPFNFSDRVNRGALMATGEMLALLNDDIEPITADWLDQLVALALDDDVGMVGPLLRFGDGRIQSAGHHHRLGPVADGRLLPGETVGRHGKFVINREVAGVTAACAVLRRARYLEVGGLNPSLPNCFNDVDLSMKLRRLGLRIVWTPIAQLFHFEASTRSIEPTAADYEELLRRWNGEFGTDPFDPVGPDIGRDPAPIAYSD